MAVWVPRRSAPAEAPRDRNIRQPRPPRAGRVENRLSQAFQSQADRTPTRCEVPDGREHLAAALMAATLGLLTAACTSASPHPGAAHPPFRTPRYVPPATAGTARAGDGLRVPSTYQQVCGNGASECLQVPGGAIPAALRRPPHFPGLRPGQSCPVSRGRPVNNKFFGGIALGRGPVWPLISDERASDAQRHR